MVASARGVGWGPWYGGQCPRGGVGPLVWWPVPGGWGGALGMVASARGMGWGLPAIFLVKRKHTTAQMGNEQHRNISMACCVSLNMTPLHEGIKATPHSHFCKTVLIRCRGSRRARCWWTCCCTRTPPLQQQ